MVGGGGEHGIFRSLLVTFNTADWKHFKRGTLHQKATVDGGGDGGGCRVVRVVACCEF